MRLLLLPLLLLAGLAGPAAADTYLLDKQHTEVRFVWNHLGMSRQSGRFLDVEGRVEFDPAKAEETKVEATMKIASLSTGVPALDGHLVKSKEYFDAAAHPTAIFKSTEVKQTGERTALMTGELTINGITRPVMVDVRWNFTGEHPLAAINPVYKDAFSSGFSASTKILRSEWGITRAAPLVSDEIEITIETEMHRTK